MLSKEEVCLFMNDLMTLCSPHYIGRAEFTYIQVSGLPANRLLGFTGVYPIVRLMFSCYADYLHFFLVGLRYHRY